MAIVWSGFYLSAAAPGVIGGDSPELTAAAHALGSAHAPGYPLYVTLGHLFQQLPLGTPGFRMTFLSITAQAMTFLLLVSTLGKLPGTGKGVALLTASLWMAGTLAFTQALSPEVIALHCLLVAFLLRWALFPSTDPFLALPFILGLSLTHHHLVLLLIPSLLWTQRKVLRQPRSLFLSLALLGVGVSTYLVLPLRAVLDPAVNWGDPKDLTSFLFLIGRGQYGGNLVGGDLVNGFLDLYLFAKGFLWESLGIGAPLLALGLWKGGRNLGKGYFLGLAFLFLVHPFLIRAPLEATTNAVNIVFLPPLFLWSLPLLAQGLGSALRFLPRMEKWVLVFAALAILSIVLRSYGLADASRNMAVTDVAQGMLRQAHSGSVLYSDGDSVTFPLAYLKLVSRLRPDLTVFDRTGGLFQDLYGAFDRPRRGLPPPARMVQLEMDFERKTTTPAVFYTESTLVPGRKTVMTGLLFQVTEAGHRVLSDELFWAGACPPRAETRHDHFSREGAARFHVFKAGHHLRTGKEQEEAGRELERAKTFAHDNGQILINIGIMEGEAGHLEEAERTLREACELLPRDPLPWVHRASLASQDGRGEDAIHHLEQAVRRDPGNAENHFRLGYQLYQAGRIAEAAQEWERTKELDPSHADAHRNLAFLHMQGNPVYAAELFRRYLSMEPGTKDRTAIEGFLASRAAP
jgi:hypothetical protein